MEAFSELLLTVLAGALVGLSIYPAIAVHELGHLVFGKLSGYRFVSFRVLSLAWFKENDRLRFSVSKNVFAGQCLMAPPDDIKKFKFAAYNLGGGIFNILFGLLLLACFFLIYNPIVSSVFFGGFIINLILAGMNLIPFAVGGTPNDGRNVRTAAKSEDAKKGAYMMLYVNNELAKGKRYRDFAPALFETGENADLNNYFAAWLVMLEAQRLEDLGERGKAFELYGKLNPEKLPSCYANEIKLNLLYHYCLNLPEFGKAPAIQAHSDKEIQAFFKNFKKSGVADFSWVVAAYEYFVMDNKDEALAIVEKALKTIKNRPNLGERIMYTEELERLGGLINAD